MSCTRPLLGYRSRVVNPDTGKRSIVFKATEGFLDQPINLPCGKCPDCRLKHSRERAIRCVHEASLYEFNCFLTLTYNPEHLPENRSLDVPRMQKFMKDLREYDRQDFLERKEDGIIPSSEVYQGVRSYGAGEYGELDGRPHYHLLLFNYDFQDKEFWREIRGNKYYRSKFLEELWPDGFSSIGSVNFDTAAYVARYVMKKFTNKDEQLVKDRWTWTDWKTGEVFDQRIPERPVCVSLGTAKGPDGKRPGGIGAPWFKKFKTDVFPHDDIVIRGKVMKVPKYYDRLLERVDPEEFASIKEARAQLAALNEFKEGPSLASKEACTEARIRILQRGLVDSG